MISSDSTERKEVVRTFLCNDMSSDPTATNFIDNSLKYQTLTTNTLADLTRLEENQVYLRIFVPHLSAREKASLVIPLKLISKMLLTVWDSSMNVTILISNNDADQVEKPSNVSI